MCVRKLLLTFFMVSILFGCNKSSNVKGNDIESLLGFGVSEKAINYFVEDKMNSKDINGASIAIVNNGEIVYHSVLGFADKENNVKVTEQTIFEGASLSKPMFAYFVMLLEQDGILDLDTPLFEYLENPEIEQDIRYKKITARMVLSHTSGLPNWRELEADKKIKILFEPGTDYNYSGEGYQYLAKVLRHLLKTDWEGLNRIFREKVTIPFGLKYTRFIQNSYTRENKAQPYDKDGNKIDWHQSYWYKKDNNVFVGASSIHTEAKEYAHWLIALMNGKGLHEKGYNVLFKDHAITPHRQFGPVKYALGFFKSDLPFGTIYSHEGGQEGFSSWFSMDKERKWAVILFANSESGGELGLDLTLFLLFGKHINYVYAVAIVTLVLVLLFFIFSIKKLLKKIRGNQLG